jgi:hypothetical protein
MKFENNSICGLNVETPQDLTYLIVKCLCGEDCIPALTKEETELVSKIIQNTRDEKRITFNQLNELLLMFNQDTLGKDFFTYFFANNGISLNDLKIGIVKFQGYAMLIFGNIKYAFKMLSNKLLAEIQFQLLPYSKTSSDLLVEFENRPKKMLEIERIPKEKTWLVGEVSAGNIKAEGKILKQVMELVANKSQFDFKENALNEFAGRLLEYETEEKHIQEIARKNTDIYLTWDYMDIYFATSMRNTPEFEETFDFINSVIEDEKLKKMALRYFDPTQSKCGNRIDKGMIEGLMLKRASCTIYMVQESDTLGKDSELAATLAQKKPVIAYVPEYNFSDYSKRIGKFTLDIIRRRLLILKAENTFNDCFDRLFKYNEHFERIINSYIEKIEIFCKKQPLRMWIESESIIKKEADFKCLCDILSIAECYRFEKRAKMLREIHPLAMQVDLETGVSNGVLVVRNPKDCASLLYRILTNNLDFITSHEEYNDEVRGGAEGYTLLIEKISMSAFISITDQKRVTNSFWNLFFRQRQNLNREKAYLFTGGKVDGKN